MYVFSMALCLSYLLNSVIFTAVHYPTVDILHKMNVSCFFNPSWRMVIHFHSHHGMHTKEKSVRKKQLTNIFIFNYINRNTQSHRPPQVSVLQRPSHRSPCSHVHSRPLFVAFQQWCITSNKNCLISNKTKIQICKNCPANINNCTQGSRPRIGSTSSPKARHLHLFNCQTLLQSLVHR